MIEIGMTYTMEKTVTPAMTAKAVGSGGLEVFGTPFMMGLMENAAMQCVQNELPEGKGTVGVEISSSHLAPTPVGMKVSATAEVTGVSANGKMITFKVTASDEEGLIGEGTHARAGIDLALIHISFRLTTSSISATRGSTSSWGTLAMRRPKAMFSNTSRWGNRAYFCNTVLICRLCGGTSLIITPSKVTSPDVGVVNPPMIRSVVVLSLIHI